MSSPERPPLQREAIIATTRELIIGEGLEALTLRRLAAQLGVTAPALYGHVKDKQDLLRAVAEDEFERLLARFDAVTETDPVARIRAYNHAYVTHAREHPETFRVMFLFPPDLAGAGDVPDDVVLPGATRAFSAAAEAVTEAVDTGALAADDPLLVALALWSTVHGVATVLQLGFGLPRELEDALVDEVLDRVLAGYRP
jgi:AcrR family transcriptional regulator